MVTVFPSVGRIPKGRAADIALPRMHVPFTGKHKFLCLYSRLHGCKLIPDRNHIAAVNAVLCSRQKAHSAELSGHVS